MTEGRLPVPSLTRGVTHKCDKGHPRVWQGQQRFSEKKDPSTQGTPSLLSCILQISALNVVPHPFASRVESVPYKSKFNGVLGYRNPFEPTLHVRSIRWELTWGGQRNRSSREGLGQILSDFKICCAVLSRVWLLTILWNVAHQAPLSMGFFQERIQEWVAISSSKGSSWPRDWTHISCVSCIAGRFFYHSDIREAKDLMLTIFKVFIEFITILFLFSVLVFWPRVMWDLNSWLGMEPAAPAL